jgi:hypothetical protein
VTSVGWGRCEGIHTIHKPLTRHVWLLEHALSFNKAAVEFCPVPCPLVAIQYAKPAFVGVLGPLATHPHAAHAGACAGSLRGAAATTAAAGALRGCGRAQQGGAAGVLYVCVCGGACEDCKWCKSMSCSDGRPGEGVCWQVQLLRRLCLMDSQPRY